MKVLIVSRGIPTKEYPLLGIFEMDQARALSQNGIDVTIFAIDLRSIRRKRKLGFSYEKIAGIDCYCYSVPIGRVPLGALNAVGKECFSVLYNRVFENEKPDVVHAHFAEQAFYAMETVKKLGIPFVVTEHSSKMAKPIIEKALLKTARAAYHSADCVIAVGKKLANNIATHTGITCEVIPNIVDVDQFRLKETRHDGVYKFISVGRLIPLKQMDVLVDAFAKVKKIYPQTTLDIYGDGEMKSNLREKIAQQELDDSVMLHGAVMRDGIADALAQSDCFVLLSSAETFGVAFIEAMAAGLPVIGLKCGGPEEYVTGKTGILLDQITDGSNEVANQMLEMCEGKVKYSNSEIREYVCSLYGADIVADQLEALYKSIISNKGN